MLYEKEGRQWLTDEFYRSPGRFIQEMGVLVDTMEEMHRQYQASGGRLGEGFFGQNQAWLNAVQALESQDPQTRQQAAARVSSSFGTGHQVGTIAPGGTAHMCKPGGGGSSSFCKKMRGTIHPRPSSQQGSRPLMAKDVLAESGTGQRGLNTFRNKIAQQGTRNAGEQYAQEQQQQQQAIAGEQATAEFLKTLRAHYDGANRGDQFWTTFTRKSTNNPEESIEIPGILNILNIPVQLYAPVSSKTRRPVSPRQQQFELVTRAQAGGQGSAHRSGPRSSRGLPRRPGRSRCVAGCPGSRPRAGSDARSWPKSGRAESL